MHSATRREFLAQSAALAGGSALASTTAGAQTRTRPHDYIVVEGHRDIWELNDRFSSPTGSSTRRCATFSCRG